MSRAGWGDGYFDGLDGVFDLEDTSFGREGVDASIVVAPGWMEMYLVLNMFDMVMGYNLKNI